MRSLNFNNKSDIFGLVPALVSASKMCFFRFHSLEWLHHLLKKDTVEMCECFFTNVNQLKQHIKKFNERKVHEVDLNKTFTDASLLGLVIRSGGCGAGLAHLLKSGVNSIRVRRNFQRANP